MFLVFSFLWNFFHKKQFMYLSIHKLNNLEFFTLAELKLGINQK